MKPSFSSFLHHRKPSKPTMKTALCTDTSGFSMSLPQPPKLCPRRDDRRHPTLEEMILQLEIEEELARNSKLLSFAAAAPYDKFTNRRMSSVTSSDVLRSARNALSQHPPRFSLDGKDAMYRSSFHKNVYGDLRKGRPSTTATACLPRWLGGERVVWCEAGVVAKLMGLEKVPVVVRRRKAKAQDRGRVEKGRNHGMQ